MRMYLGFYKVTNALNYERHTFDNTILGKTIYNMLCRLPKEEFHIYDLSTDSPQSRLPNVADFETDYNDEVLDGGWWVVYFRM